MSPSRSKFRTARAWIARHLFVYLAIVSGIVVAAGVILARSELSEALERFDTKWIFPVLLLSLLNYSLRFAKWHCLLRDARIQVPFAQSARIFFACLAMVVSPARLGELYKIVFLRRLFGITTRRSLPVMVLERVTDVMALASLCVVALVPHGKTGLIAVAAAMAAFVTIGSVFAHPRWRAPVLSVASLFGPLRRRREQIETMLAGHASLLSPRSLMTSLTLSTLAWWAECVGLSWICVGLAESVELTDATWIYALGTLVGNLTFLPGGLGGTEAALVTLLKRVEVTQNTAVAATVLIRVATLWFAVILGILVTLGSRRALQWDEAAREAAGDDPGAQNSPPPEQPRAD